MLDFDGVQPVCLRDVSDGALIWSIDAALAREGEDARIGHGAFDLRIGDDGAEGEFGIYAVILLHRFLRGYQAAEKGVDGALLPEQVGEQDGGAQRAYGDELSEQQLVFEKFFRLLRRRFKDVRLLAVIDHVFALRHAVGHIRRRKGGRFLALAARDALVHPLDDPLFEVRLGFLFLPAALFGHVQSVDGYFEHLCVIDVFAHTKFLRFWLVCVFIVCPQGTH